MDTADLANSLVEQKLENHLKHHQLTKDRNFRSVKPEGYCHTCFEEVEGAKLFCDGKCASKFSG